MALKEADYKRKSELEKDFKFNRKLKDPRFGEVSLIQNPKTRQFLAVKEKKINDKKEAGRQIVRARKLMAHNHPNLLNLKDYSVTKQSELCSSFYVLKMFYEFPRSDLHRELNERKKRGEGFSDEELTHILYQQIGANNYLQSKDQHHGNIQPLNISYDKNRMVSKLIDTAEDVGPKGKSKQMQKNRLVAGHPLYQSPITYSNLKKGNLNYTVDPAKEDVYALGLTLLEAGNQQSVQDIYNANTKEVDQEALNKHLANFQARHGQDNTLLTSTVETMVHPDEAQRPNFRDLENQLPPYNEVQTFLQEKREGRVVNATPMLISNQNNVVQSEPEPIKMAEPQYNYDADWDFGTNEANVEYADFGNNNTNVVQNDIPLESFPVVSQQEINFDQQRTAPKVQSGLGLPMVNQQPQSNKVILLNEDDNEFQNNNMFVKPNNTVQNSQPLVVQAPPVKQVDNSVSTNVQPVSVRTNSYVNQPVTYSQYQPNQSYQSIQTYQPNQSYQSNQNYQSYVSNSVQPESRRVVLEPEIRREYIDIHGNSRFETVPYTQGYESQNYHSRVSNAPSEQNVSNIRYSQAPQYVRTENVVQQQPTVVRRESNVVQQQPTVVRHESNVSRQDAPVFVKQSEPTVVYRDSRVENQGVTETVNTGELKLVNTYQDNSRATRMN